MPTISVIIATRDRAELLKRALEGIFTQTRPVDDIMIVDDASTDNTADLVKRLASHHPGVTYLRNESNVGPAESRCKALERCTSDFVIFHDDDDVWTDPHFLEEAIPHLNDEIACVCARAHSVSPSGLIERPDLGVGGRKVNGEEFLLGLDARYNKPLSTFTTLFRRQALVDSGILTSRVVNDYACYIRALSQGDVYVMDADVGAYIRHDAAISLHMDIDLLLSSIRERFAVSRSMDWPADVRRHWNERQFITVYAYAMWTSPSPIRCLRMAQVLTQEVGVPSVGTCRRLCWVPLRAALTKLRAEEK